MMQIVAIALGGAIGSVLRYFTGLATLKFFPRSLVCTGTLFSNVIGCFLAGTMLSFFNLTSIASESIILFFIVGILGSYTTFSTFALETEKILSISIKKLLIYIFLQIFAAFIALATGYGIVSVVAGSGL